MGEKEEYVRDVVREDPHLPLALLVLKMVEGHQQGNVTY